jgi:hypothetical protein
MGLGIDLKNVREQGSFELLPEGLYRMVSDDANIKTTKSGTGEYVAVEFLIRQGDYENRKIFHNFNIKNDNKTAVDIGLGQLKNLMRCGGRNVEKFDSVSDILDITVMGMVKIQKGKDGFPDRNVIAYFKATERENIENSTNDPAPF